MTINQTILELRKEKGLSQKVVADAVGISQSTIAKIEINRNEATASTIRKLADFFGVSADYLLGRSDDLGGIAVSPTAPALSEEERQLLALFGQMTHVQRVKVLAYSEGLLSTGTAANAPKNLA